MQPPLWEGVKVETRWLYFTVSGFPFFWAALRYRSRYASAIIVMGRTNATLSVDLMYIYVRNGSGRGT